MSASSPTTTMRDASFRSKQQQQVPPPPPTPSSNSSSTNNNGASSNVRVVARIRPPTEQEAARGDFGSCLAVPTTQTVEITLCEWSCACRHKSILPQHVVHHLYLHTTHTAEELGGLMESAQAFSFDRVFDPSEDQATVFEEVARPIIDGAYVYVYMCIWRRQALSRRWVYVPCSSLSLTHPYPQ